MSLKKINIEFLFMLALLFSFCGSTEAVDDTPELTTTSSALTVQETTTTYQIQKEENGVYLFVLEGKITVQGSVSIEKRDAIGIWNTSEFQITTNKETKLLLLEVPMLP